MIARTLAVAAIALAALATLACQREPDDLRGQLHAMLDDIEQIARDEIDILEELLGQPNPPPLRATWRRRLDEATPALDRLAALRAEVDASADADLEGAVGRRVTSVVDEIRRAIGERMESLRAELGGPRDV